MVFFNKILNDIYHLQSNQKPIQIGNKILRQEAYEVPLEFLKSTEFSKLINHMQNIMKKYGGQGLAASQVGIPLQIIIIEFSEYDMNMARKHFSIKGIEERKMSVIPFHVIINPKLTVTNFKQDVFEEGCLSLENQQGFVPRYREVCVEALNENGEKMKITASGWYARILQHEYHHLKGLLITDYFIKPNRFKWRI